MDCSDLLLKAQPAVALDQLKGLCDIVLCSYEKSEGLPTYILQKIIIYDQDLGKVN